MNSLTYSNDLDITIPSAGRAPQQELRMPVSAEAMHMCHCLQPILIIVRYRIIRSLTLDADFERKAQPRRIDQQEPIEQITPRQTPLRRMESPEVQSRAALN